MHFQSPVNDSGENRAGPALLDAALLAAQEVYEHELREVAGRGEVRLARSHRGHLLDELDEAGVRREHEGVHLYAGLAARLNLSERRLHDDGVAAHRVLVEPAPAANLPERRGLSPPAPARRRFRGRAFEEAGRGLPVRHHHYLLHLLALRLQEPSRELQPLGRVRVVRADLRRRETRERKLLGVVVEEHDLQRVAGVLRAYQVRERERDLLRGREAVFAVEDHRVRAVEHDDRRARGLVVLLVYVQVSVFEVDWNRQPLALYRGEERRVHVEVDGVAELVRLRRLRGLDARREVRRVVTPDRRLAEAPEQVPERLVPEEVEPLLRHLELDVARQGLALLAVAHPPLPPSLVALRGLLAQLQITLFDEALDELIEQLLQLRALELPVVLREHLLHVALRQLAHLKQGL